MNLSEIIATLAVCFMCLSFSSLVLTESAAEKLFTGAAPVENLLVEAVWLEQGHLTLNISWTKPKEGKMPIGYTILIRSSESCSDHYEHYLKDFGDSVKFIPNDFEALFGCEYQVDIKPDPWDMTNSRFYNYTVPECISGHCNCDSAEYLPKLPLQLFVVRKSQYYLNVTWTSLKDVVNISNITSMNNITHIFLRIDSYLGNSHLDAKDSKIPYSAPGWHLFPLYTHNATRKLEYVVTAKLINSHGCAGPPSKESITVASEEPPLFLWIFAGFGAVSSILVVMFVCNQRWCRIKILPRLKCWENDSRTHRWSSTYRAVSRSNYRVSETVRLDPTEVNIYQERDASKPMHRSGDWFEICPSQVRLGSQVGKGAFGQVYIARLSYGNAAPSTTVAVKKLKERATSEELDEFLTEIEMLRKVGRHPNIVALLGYCTKRPPYLMLMEFIPCGDLLRYLRQLRASLEASSTSSCTNSSSECSYITPNAPARTSNAETVCTTLPSEGGEVCFTPKQQCSKQGILPQKKPTPRLECALDPIELQNFAVQIARGMVHLESNQITHRDLAARNVLIDEHKVLKISDFGLSRSGVYVNTRQKKVPLRWLSIEAMRDNLYSSKSDVWAFAVVLWEIGTLGGFPYPTVENHDLLEYLLQGNRLQRPCNITEDLYELMLRCWTSSADKRPTFADLHKELDPSRKHIYVDFTQINPSYVFPPTEDQMRSSAVTKRAAGASSKKS